MNPELRNAIGKALFDEFIIAEEWDEQSGDFKELYIKMAEKIIEAHKSWMDANSAGMLRIAGIDESEYE